MADRIARIQITDVLGISSLVMEVGTVTSVKGPNGSGKSSLVKALLAPFAGGHDPQMIRRGTKRGEVKIELESGTQITKVITEKTSTLSITDPDGKPVKAPKEYLEKLADTWAVDPGKILALKTDTAAGKKQLQKLLLELMPITFDPEDILHRLNFEEDRLEARKWIAQPTDLDGIDKARIAVEEERRIVGVKHRDKDGAYKEGRRKLPEAPDCDYRSALSAAKSVLERHQADYADAKSQIEASAKSVASEAKAACLTDERALCEERDAKIAAIRAEYEQKILDRRTVRDGAISGAQDEAKKQLATAAEIAEPEIEAARTEVARLQAAVEDLVRIETFKEHVEELAVECRALASRQDRLGRILDAIKDAKKSKLDDLPIPGLSFEDGEVYVDGHPWHHVNTARRVSVAMNFCALRAGADGLGLIVMDDAEHLDANTRSMIDEAIRANGYQLIAAEVADVDGLQILAATA